MRQTSEQHDTHASQEHGDGARHSRRRHQGKVKWFNEAKGYGFITLDENVGDAFVHFKDIKGNGFRTLKDDQRVECIVTENPRGLHAEEVEPLPDTSSKPMKQKAREDDGHGHEAR